MLNKITHFSRNTERCSQLMKTFRNYSLKNRGLIDINSENHPKRVAYDNENTVSIHKVNEKVKVEVSENKATTTERKMRRHKCEPLDVTK